ncbi:hypothetical protein ACWEWP_02730 [Streptomyces olivaceus]
MTANPPGLNRNAATYSVIASSGLNAPGADFHGAVNIHIGPELANPLPSNHRNFDLGSVEAPYGRLPENVLGREGVLTALTQYNAPDQPRIQVLSGMGGVGKTTVALIAAERAKKAGVDVFWIQGGSAATVAAGLRHVALLAGAPVEHVALAWERGGRPAADLTWLHLASLDRPWLLVFDDADDLDTLSCPGAALADATGWVRPPAGKSRGVLITTRDGNERSWGSRITQFHRLEVLELDIAGHVLQELAPKAGNVDSARALAHRLGCLPLALHLAGNYLAAAQHDPLAEAQTFTEYIDALGDSPLLLDEATEGIHGDLRGVEERARRTISGTWELSLLLLEQQGMPHARDLLQLLSCFSSTAPLPSSLLDPATITALRMWPTEPSLRTIKRAFDGLQRFGLLKVDMHSAEPSYQIHRLVAEASFASLLAGPRKLQELWHSAADLIVAASARLGPPNDPTAWSSWQCLIPHWLVLMWRLPRPEVAVEDRLIVTFIWSVDAVSYLHFRGDYATAYELAEKSLEALSQLRESSGQEQNWAWAALLT